MDPYSRHSNESPEFAKMSQATAISLGLARGRMYRGAVNRCINLLVHYPEGCAANCAYCGLAGKRPGTYREKSFIHVDWPLFSMDRIVRAINDAPRYVKRTCISMITNGKCRGATLEMTRRLKAETRLPVSILIAPTILRREDLEALRESGADKIGVALDLATPELFDRYRGSGVGGPHKWERYWETLETALEIFQPNHDIFRNPNVGVHLMVGMGETEKQMVLLMDRIRRIGAVNHLFSFFAEEGSLLADRPQPPWPTYLRIQLTRYLLEEGLAESGDLGFDGGGRIIDFGIAPDLLSSIIQHGKAFMTTGCLGEENETACNRPFGNCLPDIRQWNYPYPPDSEEIALICRNIFESA